MQALQLLSTLRAIANNTLSACQRQEFKPEFIYKTHNDQLAAIENNLKNYSLNGKTLHKYKAEISKIKLAPMRVKSYDLITDQVKDGVSRLTSAIDFMKR